MRRDLLSNVGMGPLTPDASPHKTEVDAARWEEEEERWKGWEDSKKKRGKDPTSNLNYTVQSRRLYRKPEAWDLQ